jgi:hypothetical protein
MWNWGYNCELTPSFSAIYINERRCPSRKNIYWVDYRSLKKAYDEKDDLIYEHNIWEANNYITYIKFLTKLRDTYGYNLTRDQRRSIKSKPFIYKNLSRPLKNIILIPKSF